jgi:hypothetical protein
MKYPWRDGKFSTISGLEEKKSIEDLEDIEKFSFNFER